MNAWDDESGFELDIAKEVFRDPPSKRDPDREIFEHQSNSLNCTYPYTYIRSYEGSVSGALAEIARLGHQRIPHASFLPTQTIRPAPSTQQLQPLSLRTGQIQGQEGVAPIDSGGGPIASAVAVALSVAPFRRLRLEGQ